jgi:hypothetical protein
MKEVGEKMAILIDRTSRPHKRYNIHTCSYCHDLHGKPKPILPDDSDAKLTDRGDWICGYCLTEKMLKLNNRHDN